MFIIDPYVRPYYENDLKKVNRYVFNILPLPFNIFADVQYILELLYESQEPKVVIHLTYTGFNSPNFYPFDSWYRVLKYAEQLKGKENVTLVLPIIVPQCGAGQRRLISRLRLRLKSYCIRRNVRCLLVSECYDIFKLGLDPTVQDITEGFKCIRTERNWTPNKDAPLYKFK